MNTPIADSSSASSDSTSSLVSPSPHASTMAQARTTRVAASALPLAVNAQVTEKAPAIGDYTDFRRYLKDVYNFRRATEGTGLRPYSYSTFSAAADIKSPNYLKLIIEGRRNLSDDMISRFAKALRLNRAETEEFRVLVQYGQATEPMQRNQHIKVLADIRARKSVESGEISAQSFEKMPTWVGWVLFAMAEQESVSFDIATLQKLIRGKTNTDELQEELKKLLDSGDLVRNFETGEVRKGRDLIEAPQEVPVSVIRKLQAELIYLGIESLFRDNAKEREFGGLTVAMTEDEFQHVRFELRQLRKRLQRDLSVKRKATQGERVYQLNVQLFPLTDAK